MTCPYCGSVNYKHRVTIDTDCMFDYVEVYYHVTCRECNQDFIEHTTYAEYSVETMTLEEYDEKSE